jgi:hypothetical protein
MPVVGATTALDNKGRHSTLRNRLWRQDLVFMVPDVLIFE